MTSSEPIAAGVLLAEAPSDVRATFAAVAAGIFLSIMVFGVSIAWLRADPQSRRRWSRYGHHEMPAENNSAPARVVLFTGMTIVAVVGAVLSAVRIRPVWWGALCCYDCVAAATWWAAVAINGRRQHSRH